MDRQRYMISDAASLVNVETHVLRYWEEELELAIPRNELGHRYYTKENIEQFQKIKDWKEQGYQLKAIKMMIHSSGEEEQLYPQSKQPKEKGMEMIPVNLADNTKRLEQFQNMMVEIVKGAIEENNYALGKEVSQQVRDYVLKEMNYLMREQDEAEEARYKKLDELIRQNLKVRMKKDKKLFGRKPELKPHRA